STPWAQAMEQAMARGRGRLPRSRSRAPGRYTTRTLRHRNGGASLQEVIATLRAVEFASLPGGTAVARGTDLSADPFIGQGVTLPPGVTLGANCVVLDGAVIGRTPISNGSTTRAVQSTFGQVSIGEGSIIGCHAVIYTDTRLGRRVLVGD